MQSRFWHSTAAYAIAAACEPGDTSDLPPSGHWAYQWPIDLLKPDIVFLLTVSEAVRAERMRKRHEVETDEEKKIAKDIWFREKYVWPLSITDSLIYIYIYICKAW